jgi:hypothetical protein
MYQIETTGIPGNATIREITPASPALTSSPWCAPEHVSNKANWSSPARRRRYAPNGFRSSQGDRAAI